MEHIATPNTTVLNITYSWLTRPIVIAAAVFSMMAVYLVYTMANPAHEIWNLPSNFDWANALRYLFVEVYLIELVSGAILFCLIRLYAHVFSIRRVALTVPGVFRYQLKFLPLFLTAFFVVNPVTQTIRYWYEHYPVWHPEVYYAEYFYSLRLYLVYLIPFILMGYSVLNLNLALIFYRQKPAPSPSLSPNDASEKAIRTIKVSDIHGESYIPVDTVMWFAVEERRYYAVTPGSKMRVSLPLDKLEESLDTSKFFRINRSTIVNLGFVKSYAYWENDKYVLHMTDEAETSFTLTRQRMKQMKGALEEFVKNEAQ